MLSFSRIEYRGLRGDLLGPPDIKIVKKLVFGAPGRAFGEIRRVNENTLFNESQTDHTGIGRCASYCLFQNMLSFNRTEYKGPSGNLTGLRDM